VVLLITSRGDEGLSSAISSFEGLGGFCRVAFKPCRPSQIHASIKDCLEAAATLRSKPSSEYHPSLPSTTPQPFMSSDGEKTPRQPLQLEPRKHSFLERSPPSSGEFPQRRRSLDYPLASPRRPVMTRSVTHKPTSSPPPSSFQLVAEPKSGSHGNPPQPDGSGSQLATSEPPLKLNCLGRVLVVEDNHVNRTLLVQWLKKQKFDYEEAIDGQQAVDVYSAKSPGYFEAVLIDMSMPVLDGVGATKAIREVEKRRALASGATSKTTASHRVKIFALSGLASEGDKLRAFNAGVDGYLVKPVSFKTLAALFDSLQPHDQ